MDCTLRVKHLPPCLSAADQSDLLRHFGAERVQVMAHEGRMRHTAFASFPTHEEAEKALKCLHQLNVLGSRLLVEFSSAKEQKFHPHVNDHWNESSLITEKSMEPKKVDKEERQAEKKVDSISHGWGCQYPYNPRLTYLYPPPTETTLKNIIHTLASVPKFYVQVLHLMNKMCLPAPFGSLTPQPPLPPEPKVSSEESEIESDDDDASPTLPVKRKHEANVKALKNVKRPKFTLPPISTSDVRPSASLKPSDVFDESSVTQTRTLQIKVPEEITHEAEDEDTNVQGFGIMLPVPKETHSDDNDSNDATPTEFISTAELKKQRLSSSEMKEYSVFKKYAPGEATSRLYIKNLAKVATEKDLLYIYGRYVDWSDEEQKNRFDVRLMTEGRMKGQAFVTLPSEGAAEEALKQTNAFVLLDKPLVVQFARSARPKEKK